MYSPLFVTLMGIGTVFFGLICIIVLTTIMGSVLKSNAKPAAPAPEPRKCPYCFSIIDDKATRCPHCTSMLEEKK